MKVGILPLGRATFDVAFANENLALMLSRLRKLDVEPCGPQSMLTDMDEGSAAIDKLLEENIDRLVVLQVTFTDATLIVEAVGRLAVPLSIWAIPEPRIGGRLRLNSFCGLNLASHALSLNDRRFNWLYRNPQDVSIEELNDFLMREVTCQRPTMTRQEKVSRRGLDVIKSVSGRKIGQIGEHPDGFHTCSYNPQTLKELAGVSVEKIELSDFFDKAGTFDDNEVAELHRKAKAELDGLENTNQHELRRSLRLKLALDDLRAAENYSAFAIRCWPETFTEYGGAVCGPVSMMGENRVPCACEADVFGVLTQMILQECANQPVFLTDIVDVDVEDDSAVIWHCGQAPRSMCPAKHKPSATLHTNRKMPLLYEFPLKAGRITLMRISQSFNELSMVLGTADVLDRPMAFTGTSGILRFDRPAGEVLDDMIDSGLEHHVAIAYGDYREQLAEVAAGMKLPVLEL